MASDTQPRCRVFWVIYKMADLKLGSRLLRDLVKHPHPRDHEFFQISYYIPQPRERRLSQIPEVCAAPLP